MLQIPYMLWIMELLWLNRIGDSSVFLVQKQQHLDGVFCCHHFKSGKMSALFYSANEEERKEQTVL